MANEPNEMRLATQSTPEQIAEAQRQIDVANEQIASSGYGGTSSDSVDLVTQLERALEWGEHSDWWFERAKAVVRAAPKGEAQAAIDEIARLDLLAFNRLALNAGQEPRTVSTEWIRRRTNQLTALRRVLAE